MLIHMCVLPHLKLEFVYNHELRVKVISFKQLHIINPTTNQPPHLSNIPPIRYLLKYHLKSFKSFPTCLYRQNRHINWFVNKKLKGNLRLTFNYFFFFFAFFFYCRCFHQYFFPPALASLLLLVCQVINGVGGDTFNFHVNIISIIIYIYRTFIFFSVIWYWPLHHGWQNDIIIDMSMQRNS